MDCVVCTSPASLQCGHCRRIAYCSKKCQKLHWKVHKPVCFSIPDIEDLVVKLRVNSKECCCSKCASCCNNIPGAYDPQHVLQLAAQNPNFYDQCVQDYFAGIKPIFYLRPRMVSEAPGQRADFFTTNGSCSFLGPRGCTLKRQDMPLGCVVALGCVSNGPKADKSEVPLIWGTPSGKQAMQDFEAYSRTKNRSVGEDAIYQKQAADIVEAAKALKGKSNNSADPLVMLKLMQMMSLAS